MSPAEWTASGGAVMAGLQLVLASRRDLGPATVGIAGAAVVLAGAGTPLLALLLALTALLAALAWSRAARRRTARPGLSGLVLAVCVPAATHPWWLPTLSPDAPVPQVTAVLLVPCALAAGLGLILALEQLPARKRIRKVPHRKVKVEVQEGPAG